MHKYLKAVGYSHIESHRMLEEILQDVEKNCDMKKVVERKDHTVFAELSKDYGYDCGIAICGEYDENGNFRRDYYYPYYRGLGGITCEKVNIQRHADKESYAGAYDDFNLGITHIFYLINPVDYLKQRESGWKERSYHTLAFSALSDEGMVLLPIQKNKKESEKTVLANEKRSSLIAAAQEGDQEAIESLTMEDIDMYTLLNKRIQSEDLYSIVDETFMPAGLECDQYGLIGEILDVNFTRNSRTNERLYELRITSNGIVVDVCINEQDLMGIPEVGRRFKGKVWLQGLLDYEY